MILGYLIAKGVEDFTVPGNTPLTPVFLPAETLTQLRDAGFETHVFSVYPEDIGLNSKTASEAQHRFAMQEWEPLHPKGEGWFLHYKGANEEGDIKAIWARKGVDLLHFEAQQDAMIEDDDDEGGEDEGDEDA